MDSCVISNMSGEVRRTEDKDYGPAVREILLAQPLNPLRPLTFQPLSVRSEKQRTRDIPSTASV
jgi:hypothetical protein